MRKTKNIYIIMIGLIFILAPLIKDTETNFKKYVQAAPSTPGVTENKKTMYVGDKNHTIKLSNTSSKATVTYKSSNSKVAKVTSKGVVKPLAIGNAKITVKIKQNKKTYTSTVSITVKGRPVEQGNVSMVSVFRTGFESGTDGFIQMGNTKVDITNEVKKAGKNSLKVSDRSDFWTGAQFSYYNLIEEEKTYYMSAWVIHMGTESALFSCSYDFNQDYLGIAEVAVKKNTWTKIEGYFHIPKGVKRGNLRFNTFYTDNQNVTFFIDDLEIWEATVNKEKIKAIPSLKEAYKDYFDVGAQATEEDLLPSMFLALRQHHFDTITMGYEMKPGEILDENLCRNDPKKYDTSPAIKTDKMEEYLQKAMDNGFKLRFHLLVSYADTPRWFFTKNYSNAADAQYASKAVVLKRLENYIKQVMECTKKYPGVIISWDVINEAIEPAHYLPNNYRGYNPPYEILGEEYVEKAFEYARKYSYDNAGLFYNDYNTFYDLSSSAIINLVEKLKKKNLIDGLGIQGHFSMEEPTLEKIESYLRKYGELGLEVHITEIDVHCDSNSIDAQNKLAEYYYDLFEIFVRLKKEGAANITNVTFWGVLDSDSWLTNLLKIQSYPLLFDKDGIPKPAFYRILDVVK